ncbi:hypothetical protein HO133_005979 [Letharia lupina]|uniref:C2H2-type domain-containing protein n=1 Tax=Letharia lupina TaxID=560253 RepID=A0A8H6F8G5_9LECA|nr:uncharacterized protein HO133_005979 [Letharia lupina]KAF6218628.1 hypothetical protein HO133_005979 [Letharia lupina]
MPLSPTPPAFSRSLEAFKCQLSLRDIEAFGLTNFQELRNAIDSIQNEQAHRRGYRNLNKIRPFLEFLQQYARVIEQFVSAKPDFLAFIWVASRLSDAFDALLEAYARIGESLPVFAAVDTLFSARGEHYVQQILANVYEDILKFHSRAVIFFKQRTWTIAFKTAFRSFSDLYGDVVKNLQGSKELLIQTASVWHFREAQDARLRISQEFEAQNYRDDQHRKSFVVDWLSHVSCQNRHEELRQEQRLYSASTRWVFDTTQLSEWSWGSETSSPVLWISGIPGAGKTFIFSSIVEDINERLSESEVIYFYCRYDDPLKTSFNGIVRCLIAQLLALNPTCSQYLYDEIIGRVNRHPDSANDLCTEMLQKIALHHEQLFIGIDGLDECQEPERRQTLLMIHNLLKASKTKRNIRVFLTSRKEQDIGISLRSASRLDIRPYHLDKDIKDYVRVRALDLSKKFSIALERQRTIIADIARRSQARLIMDNLIDQDCRQDLEEELSDEVLPNGIGQAYTRILDRMQKRNQPTRRWQRAKFGLDVLVMATRPLTIHEVQGAFSICLENGSIDFENRRSVAPLDELLGPIVEVHLDGSINFIHPTARDPCLDLTDVEVSVYKGDYAFQEYAALNWIHHIKCLTDHGELATNVDMSSLKTAVVILFQRHFAQFATDNSDSSTQDLEFNMHSISAALDNCQKSYDMVDNICVNETDSALTPYILRGVFEVRGILEKLPPQVFKDSPLLAEAYGRSLYKCPIKKCSRFQRGFASRNLRDEHLQSHERAHKCTVEGCEYLVIGFPTRADLTRHKQLCHCELNEEFMFPSVKRASLSQALENAIDRDDASAVRDLCAEMSVYPTNETGFLFRAVKQKSFGAALVLLELLGSDQIHHKAKNERTVLHEAVETTHVDLLKKILSTDVDVDAEDSRGRTPLLIALEHGHFDAVRLLWSPSDKKWTVKWKEAAWRKGFVEASSGGHDDIVPGILSTLVGHLADGGPNLSATISRALSRAASNNHETTVKKILHMGRAMDLEKNYSKRLKEASRNGMEGIKQLEQPEVDGKGKTKGNALADAARKNDSATVLRLLEKGADINYSSGIVYNALGAAARYGELSMIHLLLDNGADVNAPGGYYGDALQIALSAGHDQVVQVLLDRGADIKFDGKNNNALGIASSKGYDQVVQILLDKGADVNAYDGNALQVASLGGHDQVVQILLDKGANINAQGGTYGNALYAALLGGYDQVVQILLDKGADVNAQDETYGNALHEASSGGRSTLVQILLDKGADVNAEGGCHGNALQAALSGRHDRIVQMLLDRGAISFDT